LGVLENHPPPVQVSNEAKAANKGPHRNISINAVVAVMMDKSSSMEDGESLAESATIQMQASQQILGNLI
jgi:hypothetical protein